jgi:hypothetical protein
MLDLTEIIGGDVKQIEINLNRRCNRLGDKQETYIHYYQKTMPSTAAHYSSFHHINELIK